MEQTLSPKQLVAEAKRAYEQEEYLEAAKAFQAAEVAYMSNNDELQAAEMANNRSVALLQEGDAQAALEAVGKTAEYFAAIGDQRRQALAFGNEAAALAALDRPEEAESIYWECAKILKEINETELRTSVMTAISRLQMRSGRHMEAVASMQTGLDEIEKPSLSQKLLKKLLQVPSKFLNR